MFIPYAHLTQDSVSQPDAVAILPLAAMETHGPHLPLGTDGLIAEGILDRAAALDQHAAHYLRLPLMWLGASAEHAAHGGTLSVEPEQVITQIEAVGEGLARAGIRRLVLFNAHGGNIAAGSIAALKLRTRFNLLVASAHWLDFGLPYGFTPPSAPMADVHGGWVETSLMMHMTPNLVVRGQIAAREPVTPAPGLFPNGPIAWGWKIDDLTQGGRGGGWIGRPDLADPEFGKQLLNHAAEKLLVLLHDLAAADWQPK